MVLKSFMPSISIIIPSYNGAELLKDCLLSLANQHQKPSEVIVVDDGSSDNTEQIIKQSSIDVILIRSRNNEGFSRATNKGIRKSISELVMIVNNDVTLHKECIAELQIAASNLNYSSFCPLIFQHNERQTVHSAGLMYSNRGYGNRSNRTKFSVNSMPTDVFSACGAVALYRRTALDEVGLLNENFFFFFEDLELGLRLQLQGHRCLLVPSAHAYHVGGATAQHVFPLKVEQSIYNSIHTLLVCVPRSWIFIDSLRIIKFYYLLIYNCWMRGYRPEVVRALGKLFIKLPSILKDRYSIQEYTRYDKKYLRQLVYTDPIEINFPDKVIKIPLF
jgi:GT2 family glycosyltransferase